MKRPDGQPVTTGWLVEERPVVALLLGGDQSVGLDADALTAITQSIHRPLLSIGDGCTSGLARPLLITRSATWIHVLT